MAGLRMAKQLPGVAAKAGRGLLRDWRDAVKGLKGDLKAESDAAKTGTRPPLKGRRGTTKRSSRLGAPR